MVKQLKSYNVLSKKLNKPTEVDTPSKSGTTLCTNFLHGKRGDRTISAQCVGPSQSVLDLLQVNYLSISTKNGIARSLACNPKMDEAIGAIIKLAVCAQKMPDLQNQLQKINA